MVASVSERALDAAARCVARDGVAATTLDVVAREAGVARATLYRHFPGGRSQLFDELVAHEVGRFFRDLYDVVGHLDTIDEVLIRGLIHAHAAVSRHFLLQTVLREDPSILEPGLTVALSSIESQVAAVLRPFLPRATALDERADVLSRMALDYISTQGRWDLSDETRVGELVRDELLAWRGARTRTPGPARVRPLRRVHDVSVRGRVVEATLAEIAAGRFTQLHRRVRRRAHARVARDVYRSFPGGRDAMIGAAVDREAARLFASVADAMASENSLHACLLAGLTTVWHHVAGHEAIRGFVTSEPERARRALRFESATRTYYVASSFASPLLGRWLDSAAAGRMAEWICRIVVSYWLTPAPYLDIADPVSVAQFYGRHLAPGVERMAAAAT